VYSLAANLQNEEEDFVGAVAEMDNADNAEARELAAKPNCPARKSCGVCSKNGVCGWCPFKPNNKRRGHCVNLKNWATCPLTNATIITGKPTNKC